MQSTSFTAPHPERDAVLGDLAESNATPAGAFKDMLGLVLRRRWPSVLRLTFLAVFFLVFSFGLSGSSLHLIRSTDQCYGSRWSRGTYKQLSYSNPP